jgi:NADPH:quinone reductase-like Zn-dependent oxidoreductase
MGDAGTQGLTCKRRCGTNIPQRGDCASNVVGLCRGAHGRGGAVRAIVYQNFGSPDILHCEDIEKPLPGDDEVLIKIRAASINPLDWKVMKGGPLIIRLLFGLGKPKIKRPGVDVAGELEAVGSNITQLKVGDAVFGVCNGAFAEYAIAKRGRDGKPGVVVKPDQVTYEQAASAPVAALTALQGLRDHGRIQAGQSVLVNGAAGGVGTFAVQIAKSLGAQVTGVCSARNLDLVRLIGADQAIDYAQQDFTKGGQLYDVILDCVGNHRFSACKRVLRDKGIFVGVGASPDVPIWRLLAGLLGALAQSALGSQKMKFFIAKVNQQDLTAIGELMATGQVTPVIDRCYGLDEVRAAFRYMEDGHARGKVIVTPV